MNFSGRQWDEQEILELTLKEADNLILLLSIILQFF